MAGIPAGYLGVMDPNPSTAMLVQRTIAATESYVPGTTPPATPAKAATTVPTGGSPGAWAGTPPVDAAALRALPAPARAYGPGEYVVVGNGKAWAYDGAAWQQVSLGVKGAAAPAKQFPAEATVTASDAANAAKLAGLGFVAAPTTAWATGEGITVGAFDFHWDGTKWAPGGAP